jgi:hypothetical protein
MRLLPLIAVAILFSCGAAHAQSAMTGAGMGMTSPLTTSPLGMLGSSASNGSNSTTGIPLGATEIDPGGLSPAPVATCNSSGSTGLSGSGMAATPAAGSVFDGGGFGSTTTSACASTSASASSATSGGLASPLSSMGTNSDFTLNGGSIPLGSTEIDSAGISPLITTPMSNSLMP